MLKLKKAFKSYRHSGAFKALLTPRPSLLINVIITKTGDVGMVLKVEGIDYECLPDTMLEEQASRFEASIRSLMSASRLYQYVIKRDGATIPTEKRYASDIVDEAVRNRVEYLRSKRDQLFTLELYIVVLYESKRFLTSPRRSSRHRSNRRSLIRSGSPRRSASYNAASAS